jgi:hypothetical protein
MQDLLPKITLSMPPEMPSLYNTGRYTEVVVHYADREPIRARCSNPRGSWGAPPISRVEHTTKVRTCLSTYLSPGDVDDVVDLAARVETLDGATLRRLVRIASGRPVAPQAA